MGNLLVLDIGGTAVKYGIADGQGTLFPASVRQVPSGAEGSAREFLDTLRGILGWAREEGRVEKAAACIAGPFDFDRGVSLMKHKFQALYGQSLTPPFQEMNVPVSFLHDSTAFMLGESHFGSLRGARNACCVMLGTGLGFAWAKDGRVCVDATRTPSLALWKTPYGEGIAEDYVSTRALWRYYGQEMPIKEMAALARQGDRRAEDAFLTAGRHLSRILKQVIQRLGCEKFALGGQIAKSADLFQLALPVPWEITRHLDDAALLGACRYAAAGREGCEQAVSLDFAPLEP